MFLIIAVCGRMQKSAVQSVTLNGLVQGDELK